MKEMLLLGVVLACASGSLCAEDLLCTGTAHLPIGTGIDAADSRILKIDFQTLAVSMDAFYGQVSGTAHHTDKSYTALMIGPNHYQYSLSLDRYSGQLVLMGAIDPSTGNRPIEFWGTCARATPKF
jgi:hypothetical protein